MPTPLLSSWSFSRVVMFEACPLQAKLKFSDRIPEPDRPLRPGQTEHANDRGTRIHTHAERFVLGQEESQLPEMRHFANEFNRLRKLHSQGQVSLEGEWGHDDEWEICDWRTAWLRLKIDALVFDTETHAVVIDYKTGRKFGNELKHGQQAQLYQLATFLRYPALEKVTTELWYLDQDDITTTVYTRDQGLRFKRSFDARGRKMTSAVSFPANPNMFSCRYCPYGPGGTGHCSVGVTATKGKKR